MRKFCFMVVVIILVTSLSAKLPEKIMESRDISASQSLSFSNASRDPWDLLLQFDVDTPTGQTGLAGMEWDGTHFHITKWSGSAQHFKFDAEGNYIEAINVPVTGARDLAFDGEFMYGSAATSEVYCWDPETGAAIPGNNITVAGAAVRAIAYDPLTDTFWSGNWGDPVINWDRDGNILNTWTIAGDVDLYGLAYDWEDPEGPFLYGFHQTPGCTIVKLDPNSGTIMETVDVTANGGTAAIAGGLCYMSDWDPALRTLGALLQGTPDYVCVYELGENAPVDSPAGVDMFTVTPDPGGALTADLGWMNPTETVGGAPLTDLDEMRIYRDNNLIHTITNPVIGGIVNWTDNVPGSGLYGYSVVGFNDAGEGIPVSAAAYIGEDVPAAVTNITLENDGGDALLNWVNPTTGLHGGPFNQPILGYHIERNDGENFEPTGIMNSWTDTTIPMEGLYSYTITPYNSVGDGGSASSEPAWIGASQAAMFGDPNTTTTHYYTPIDFWYKNSLSQTIYYADEFAAQGFGGGAITGIMYYNNFVDDLPGKPINIWMQNTELENLSGGWVPATDMQQVFTGTLDFPIGINEIMIGFEEPFIYEGANVIIFVERVMDTQYFSTGDTFYYTDTQYTDRCLWAQNDVEDYDPYNPPTTINYLNSCPNTMMFINTEGLGSLEGYAYDSVNNDPLEGVLVELIERRLHTFTDANGYYNFPGLFEGTYDAHATLFAHSEDIQTVVIVEDQTTYQDFYLTPVIEVEVTGRVVGSDYPAIGLAGAEVTLSGMGIHEGITDDDGYFVIPGVFASNTYQLTVVAEGYEVLVGEAVVGNTNTDLGDIIVNEIAFPPFGVMATQNPEDTVVDLIWEAPDPAAGNFWDFENDNGDFVANQGWEWGQDAMPGAFSGVNVWGTVFGANYANSASYELVTPEVNIPTDDAVLTFWHWMDMETYWDGGNVKISADGGASWTLIDPVGGYPGTANGLGGEACFNGYTQTWELATFEIGAYQGEDVMFKFHFGSDSSINYYGWYIDDVFIGMPDMRVSGSDNSNFTPVVSLPPRQNFRMLEGFNIYRLLLEDENNPELWDTVVTGIAPDVTEYTDLEWNNLESDIYEYGVVAVYTNNVMSDAAFSNWVAKDYYTTADIMVEDFWENPIVDADVDLTCLDPDPDGMFNSYEMLTDNTGNAFFPMLWKGNYDIRVSKDNMQTYELEGVPIFEPYVLEVVMTEEVNPISGLDYSVTGDDVQLWWNAPSSESFFDFESDNGEFTAEAGWEWANGCNAGFAWSGVNCWSCYPNGDYPNSANSSLYSCPINIPSDEAQLTFYHWYDIESYFDGGNVKISIDGGTNWEIITPVGEYPEDAATTSNSGIPGEPCYCGTSGGWVPATFEIGMYAGEEAIFRFHFGSDSSVQYPGWDIDDVRVGAPLERPFEGYNVYRNGTLIAEDLQVEEYYDENVPDGTYTYGVGAQYTTGESEIIETIVDVYPVDITGYVTASDTPDTEPLSGAFVSLENEMFYWETTTDAAGEFSLLNVNGNQTYDFTVTYEGYQTYSEVLTVTDLDVDYPLLILLEMINPPYGVIAEVNPEDTVCDLIWNAPGLYPEYEIVYDDDIAENATAWYDEGNERAVWFTAQGGPCFVTGGSMHIYDGSWPAGNILVPFTAAVWEYDGATGMPGEMLGCTEAVPTDYGWVNFEFETPIPIDGSEFFLGYAQGGNYPDCAPVAVDETIPTVGRSYEHYVTGGGVWEYSSYQDFMLRAIVQGPTGRELTIGYENPVVDFSSIVPHKGAVSQHAVNIPQDKKRTGNAAYFQSDDYTPIDNLINEVPYYHSRDRELLGYHIIIGEFGDEMNWETWDDVTTETIEDTFYSDTNWTNLQDGIVYTYGVQSVYTNDHMSNPAFSNWVGKNMYATLEVTLTSNAGIIPVGAEVTIEATEPDPEGNYPEYTATTNQAGICTISNIWKGNYDLTASLDDFTTLEDNIDIMETFEYYQGMLIEILYEPVNLAVDPDGILTWEIGTGGPGLNNILFVDDDGSIDLAFTDTYPYYENILNSYRIDWDWYEIEVSGDDGPDADYMSDYDLVIWECGEQWAMTRTLTDNDELALAEYLDDGGYLVLNAHDYFYDRYPSAGAFYAGQFPYDYLGVSSALQDAFTVGESQGGPANVIIDGDGCTDGLSVLLQDIFSALRDGVYLDYLTPNAMGESYSTYEGNIVGVQTENTIFTCAGWAGLIDGDDSVLDYTSASLDYFGSAMRPVEYFNIYIDGDMVGSTTDYSYDLTTIPGLMFEENYLAGVTCVYTSGYESPMSEIEFTCTWETILYGDVTGDGTVDAYDAANVLQYTVGMDPVGAPLPWSWEMVAANVSGDDEVDAYDAALILQYSVGMIDIFPVETRLEHSPPMAELKVWQIGDQLIFNATGEMYSVMVDLDFDLDEIDFMGNDLLHCINGSRFAAASATPLSGKICRIQLNSNQDLTGSTVYGSINGREFTLNIEELPQATQINSVYPNPFNPITTIKFSVAEEENVKILLYNMRGQRVETIINEVRQPGIHQITWEPKNISSGIYFLNLQTKSANSRQKILLLK